LHDATAAGGLTVDLALDKQFMRAAIVEAQAAGEAGEVPIGAIVVQGDQIVGRGQNSVIRLNDPTAHAEVVALRDAGRALKNYRLESCTVYATLEPCSMCAGALIHARIGRLVYSTPDPKAGAAGSVLSIINHPGLNHTMEIFSGPLADESAALLRTFFRERR
jgi:tRNA(adenine34) deaminase